MRRQGFTLIELLVVIAIIAILAAILFPVFISAKEKAQQSACLSNAKQIGSGLLLYCEAYDDILPENGRASYAIGLADPKRWFSNQMMKFVKNASVWNCPTAVRNASCFHSAAGRDYGMAAPYCKKKAASFYSTSKTPIITDCRYNAFYSDEDDKLHPGWFTAYTPYRVHSQGANYIFVDGHAKWSKEMVINDPHGEYRLGELK